MAGPLTSLKVLDFSTLLPGPYATMLLADMGGRCIACGSTGPGGSDTGDAAPMMRG